MKTLAAILLLACLVWAPCSARADDPSTPLDSAPPRDAIPADEAASTITWNAELFLGAATSLPTKMTIRQLDLPAFDVHAKYEGRPFEFPPYFSLRASRWEGDRAWALQLTHHRVVVKDPPPEIASFVSGYNLVTLNRLIRMHGLILGAGIGGVIVHPTSVVRGERLDNGGYSLAGPTGALSAGYERPVNRDWFVTGNVLFSGSYARIPVQDGHASTPNFSLHGQLGVARHFGRSPAGS